MKAINKFCIKVLSYTSCVWPDKMYLSLLYYLRFGKILDLKNPQTFSQKLNWEKIYDRNPLYTKMADKYEVKKHVANIIGDEYVVSNYGVWEKFDQIDFSKLPNQFILKCTHDSSGVVPCKNKASFDLKAAKQIIGRSLRHSYYLEGREWPYKNVRPRIIADMLLDDGRTGELQDYKWWCFNGEPKVMYITNKGIAGQVYENFYDMEFNVLDIDHGFPRIFPEYDKPKEFELMKELAAKLSQDIPFVRVDFFDIHGKVYFGEFTFFDHAGLRPFVSEKWDNILGEWLNLTKL